MKKKMFSTIIVLFLLLMLYSCKDSDPCRDLDSIANGKAIVSASSIPTGRKGGDMFAYRTGFQMMDCDCRYVFDDYTSESYSTGDTVLVKNGYIIGYY